MLRNHKRHVKFLFPPMKQFVSPAETKISDVISMQKQARLSGMLVEEIMSNVAFYVGLYMPMKQAYIVKLTRYQVFTMKM